MDELQPDELLIMLGGNMLVISFALLRLFNPGLSRLDFLRIYWPVWAAIILNCIVLEVVIRVRRRKK